MDVGKRIKELRMQNNLTQDELATKLGLKKAAVHKYESGLVENIKRSTIQEMASIFNVSPCYILGWEDSNNSKHKSLTNGENELLEDYNKLNDLGKKEATKRVKELSLIEQYMSQDTLLESINKKLNADYNKPTVSMEVIEDRSHLIPKASHDKEGNFTEEDYKHDDDLMLNDDLWK